MHAKVVCSTLAALVECTHAGGTDSKLTMHQGLDPCTAYLRSIRMRSRMNWYVREGRSDTVAIVIVATKRVPFRWRLSRAFPRLSRFV